MRHSSGGRRTLSAAQRGQIVQRVIVDGWTPARAAGAFGVPQRLVEIWTADYRKHGMASLRHAPRRTVAAELFELWLVRPTVAQLHRVSNGLRVLFVHPRLSEPAPLRQTTDDWREGSS